MGDRDPSGSKVIVERIVFEEIELALIIRHSFHKEGIEFFTPNTFSQQIGYMNRPAGYVIDPHVHNPVQRAIHYTKEVLLIKSGKLRVDFYSEAQDYLESTILNQGDVILLSYGGHGFEMLEPTEIIEVKQGPYAGDVDKTRFKPVNKNGIRIRNNGS